VYNILQKLGSSTLKRFLASYFILYSAVYVPGPASSRLIISALGFLKSTTAFSTGFPSSFISIVIGTMLPLERVLTRKDLTKISGQVVLTQADLSESAFFVLVYDYDKYSIYRVSPEVYVEDLDIGTRLPLAPKVGSGAQVP